MERAAPTITESHLFLPRSLLPEAQVPESARARSVDAPAPGVRIDWSLVLEILDRRSDWSHPESEAAEDDDVFATQVEIFGPTLRMLPWAAPWERTATLRSQGQLIRPDGFSMEVRWYRGAQPLSKPPRLLGAVVLDKAGLPAARLSHAQWLCLEATHAPKARTEMELRLRVERLLRAVERANASAHRPSVTFDAYLTKERAEIIETMSADIVPVDSGYQLVPDSPHLAPDALSAWYFGHGARVGYERGLRIRNRAGGNPNVIFAESALKTVRKLRELNVVDDDTVARVLDDPQALLGADFDVSVFSPRVRAVGFVSRETVGIVSDSRVTGWFGPTGDDLPDGDLALDFSDPTLCQALLDVLISARDKGLNWFKHPQRPGVFIPITALLETRLRERIDAARAAEAPPTQKVGLVVDDATRQDELEPDEIPGLHHLVPLPALPRDIHLRLKPHQVLGVRWLLTLSERDDTGALLADDMGLGKTLQVLSLLSALDLAGRKGPHLVVAPVGLLANWRHECDRYFPDQFEDIRTVRGSLKPWDAPLGHQSITLAGYDTVRANEFAFARVQWDVVVLDEAQKIKNPTTQVNRVARALAARLRVALTGTPVENSLEELWSIMDWAVPARLGSLPVFRRDFIAPLAGATARAKEALAARLLSLLQPHFLRRLKQSELASELPAINRATHRAPLGALQESRYLEILRARRAGQLLALPALQRLLDTCAHPELSDGLLAGHLEGADFPKAAELLRILKDVEKAGEKAIIFSNRRPVQDWLASLVRTHFGFQPAIVNGEVSSSELRMDLVERFSRRDGFRVLILGPRAAGVGLNITAANHVIHYTREWNPAIEAQATDRAYRMGQKRPVHVHTIVVGQAAWGSTVEEKLAELLEKKQELIRRFVIPVEPVVVSQEELLGEM